MSRFASLAALLLLAAPAAAQDIEAESKVEAEAEAPAVRPAGAEDVQAGMRVVDTDGGLVGTVESVEADGAIVAAGEARAKLPFSSFGRSGDALVITMSRAELQAAVDARTPG